ncbi:MAG: Omp28-related outer membrane protein [Bacteroidia bacterium]|nr:Omp28-related outer membrane protein [Bacteroidia bacterium]
MKKITFLIQLMCFSVILAVNAQTVILTENFQTATGQTPPTGWTRTQNTPSYGWEFGINTAVQSGYFQIPAHTIFACSNDDAHDNSSTTLNLANIDRLISPALNLTTYTAVVLKFSTVCPNQYGSSGSVEASTNGGTTWTSIYTIPTCAAWTDYTVSLGAYLSATNLKICFRHNDGGEWGTGVAVDDVEIFQPVPLDLGITQLTMQEYIAISTNFNVTGIVKNFGATAITSYDINYTINGGAPVTYNVTGVNIAPYTTSNFTFPAPVNFSTTGSRTFVVTITNSNGTPDPVASNNSLTTTVGALSYVPVKRVLGEEGTGTWCGWCPRGAVYMEQMATDHPDTWIGIAVHNGDPMVVTNYDAAMGNYIGGYPSGLVDRQATEFDPTDFNDAYIDRITKIAPVDMSITSVSWNSGTRSLSFTVQGVLAGDFNGNYRFNAVLTEDQVHGTTTSYNQANYYSGGTTPLNGAGHNWQTEPDPVLAANMYYDHVARYLFSGWSGAASSIPATNIAGATISKAYTYTLPAIWNENNMNIIGFIVNQTNGEIVNACKSDVLTAIGKVNTNEELVAYPNPTTGIVHIKYSKPVNVAVYNILGELITTVNNTTSVNMNNLPAGNYFLKIDDGKNLITKKIVLTK